MLDKIIDPNAQVEAKMQALAIISNLEKGPVLLNSIN